MSDLPSSRRLELLPAVDVADGQAVQLVQGVAGSEKRFGDPVEAALNWQSRGAEWIHLVDLDAAFGRGHNRELLAEIVGTPRHQGRDERRHPRRRVARGRAGRRLPPRQHRHRRARAARVVRRARSPSTATGSPSASTSAAAPWPPAAGPARAATSTTCSRASTPRAARATSSPTSTRTACSRARTSSCCATVCARHRPPGRRLRRHHRARRPRGARGPGRPRASRAPSSAPRSTRAASPSRTRSRLTAGRARVTPRRPRHPVPRRRRRPGGQGRQLPGAARRRRPGRAGQGVRRRGRRRADLPRHLRLPPGPGHHDRDRVAHRRAGLHPAHRRRRESASVDDVDTLLRAGADKVAVNTAAIRRPELIAEIADRFGNQVLVLSVDARRAPRHRQRLRGHHARRPPGTGLDAVEWAARGGRARRRRDPAQRDGRRRHPGRLRPRADPAGARGEVSIPVIASGGAGPRRALPAGGRGRRRRRARRQRLPLRHAADRRGQGGPWPTPATPSAEPATSSDQRGRSSGRPTFRGASPPAGGPQRRGRTKVARAGAASTETTAAARRASQSGRTIHTRTLSAIRSAIRRPR